MKKTAILIKENLPKFNGVANLYRCDPPMKGHDYIVVSAVKFFSAETEIFPSDEFGRILDWVEMPGSYKGGCEHKQALRNAGYEVQLKTLGSL